MFFTKFLVARPPGVIYSKENLKEYFSEMTILEFEKKLNFYDKCMKKFNNDRNKCVKEKKDILNLFITFTLFNECNSSRVK